MEELFKTELFNQFPAKPKSFLHKVKAIVTPVPVTPNMGESSATLDFKGNCFQKFSYFNQNIRFGFMGCPIVTEWL